MRIISLTPNPNGSYNDHISDNITTPPDGWAMWPDSLPIPACYPFFESLTAEEVGGVMTVTGYVGGTLPEPAETTPEPTLEEQNRADIDFLAIMMGVEL